MTEETIRQLAEKYAYIVAVGQSDDEAISNHKKFIKAIREACALERAEVVEACARVLDRHCLCDTCVELARRIRALAAKV